MAVVVRNEEGGVAVTWRHYGAKRETSAIALLGRPPWSLSLRGEAQAIYFALGVIRDGEVPTITPHLDHVVIVRRKRIARLAHGMDE